MISYDINSYNLIIILTNLGVNKLTIILSESLHPFGSWIEQLLEIARFNL